MRRRHGAPFVSSLAFKDVSQSLRLMSNILTSSNHFLCVKLLFISVHFQHHYSSRQCHMIFRNHNNMLICCSKDINII